MSLEEAIISLRNVTKAFGEFKAIDNISLDIPKGSFTTLLGPSGCGKTTLMRLIAGFYEPEDGEIYIEGNKVNGLPPFKRNTPLVFQDYALFPHMTVYENIAYGLKIKKENKNEIKKKVQPVLEMFGINGMEDRFPKQLSGGQQQRVAFGRALITGQKILMLDEPLSNLDAKLRVEVRNELRALQQRLKITTIFVTHDQDEALSMSDYIAVFKSGRVCQFGTPWDIYFKPNSRYVAGFVGIANFIEGKVIDINSSEISVEYNKGKFISLNRTNYEVKNGEYVTLVIRPECISLSYEENPQNNDGNILTGEIITSSFLGHLIRYWIRVGDKDFVVDDSNPGIHGFLKGRININLHKDKIHILSEENS